MTPAEQIFDAALLFGWLVAIVLWARALRAWKQALREIRRLRKIVDANPSTWHH